MSSTPINRGRDIRHPAGDRWAVLAAGLAAKPEADDLLAHAAECPACAGLLKEALEFLADEPTDDAANNEAEREFLSKLETSGGEWRRATAQQLSRPAKTATPIRVWLPLAAAVVLALGGGLWWSLSRGSNPETLLARAYTEARPFEYRLPDAGYGPVRQERGAGSAFDRAPSLVSAEAEIARGLAGNPNDPRLLALRGRSQLLERDYEGAIQSLTRALELKPGDAGITADLGAGYALRAGVGQRAEDYRHAIDLFLEVLNTQPANTAVLFNLGLAYEGLGSFGQAGAAWQQLLRSNPPPDWKRETMQHKDAVEKPHPAPALLP